MLNKLSLPLLIVSVLTLTVATVLIYQRFVPISHPDTAKLSQTNDRQSVVRIRVPDVDIDLAVYPAKLEGTKWEYTSQGVSHLVSTPGSDLTGNSIFYGHNWPNILSHLHSSQVGQTIVLSTAGGVDYTYAISQIKTVSASHIDILAQSDTPLLTLFTCTGFLDSKRLVLTALPL